MSFASQVKAFTDKAKHAPLKTQSQIFIELSKRVIDRTPVKTGRAKANWQSGLGSPNNHTTKSTDVTGAESINRAQAVAVSNTGIDLYLTNSLPYIGVLENGSSKQAPAGMVKVSAREFDQITTVVVRGLG